MSACGLCRLMRTGLILPLFNVHVFHRLAKGTDRDFGVGLHHHLRDLGEVPRMYRRVETAAGHSVRTSDEG